MQFLWVIKKIYEYNMYVECNMYVLKYESRILYKKWI